MTPDALAASRSLRRGTVDAETVRTLSKGFRSKVLAKVVAEIVDDIDSYDGDVFVHEGDLLVDGDFDTSKLGVAVLVVEGDLAVSGCYRDYDDPESIVVVNGSLRARDVVTAGFLDVAKNLEAKNAIVGDYNDCNAVVGGDVTCKMFYPEEHFFRVGGELRAKYLVGNVRYRVEPNEKYAGIARDDPKLVEIFPRELLRVQEEDGELTVDGFESFGELKKRVLSGELVFD